MEVFSMKNVKLSTLAFCIAFTNLSFCAIIKIGNSGVSPIDVIARYGTNTRIEKTVTIQPKETVSTNTGVHNFQSTTWREHSKGGIHYSLATQSPRLMLSGIIEIYPNGNYIMNFDRTGVLLGNRVIYGNAQSSYRADRATYAIAVNNIMKQLKSN